ncbi:hypothetical protein jhhlp_004530 [Lomentospora prolificans]|uniref:Uncharacterized protein n=1 Tax=Lomentospora prolificans TaxID=41688 RepID=A0A2N3NBY5_9PEZI|nr:hypothetical protein jhhlp_004530 [Lomentospora prolificans]
MCPYTLSPIHLYATSSPPPPLPKAGSSASLAALTTKTAIFSIDAAVHLAHIRRSNSLHPAPLPLELVVTQEMLALACLVAVWLLVVSRTASASAARGLVKAWCVAVAVGCVVAFVALREVARGNAVFAGPDACAGGVVMPAEAVLGSEVVVPALGAMGSKVGEILTIVAVPGLVFAALTLAFISAKGPAGDIARRAKTIDLESLPTSASPDIIQPNPSVLSSVKLASLFRKLLMAAVPAMGVVVVHRTETYLLKMQPAAPESEPITSVGQWGIWAATGVVLLGTFVNAAKEGMGYTSEEEVRAEKSRLQGLIR